MVVVEEADAVGVVDEAAAAGVVAADEVLPVEPPLAANCQAGIPRFGGAGNDVDGGIEAAEAEFELDEVVDGTGPCASSGGLVIGVVLLL